jgi:hypothetical protein
MPRVLYDGAYRPDMVPFQPADQVARDYAALAEPKALAIAPSPPRVRAATGATVAEAEAKALAACNDPGSGYPCFLYAVNARVVLPLRRTEPRR